MSDTDGSEDVFLDLAQSDEEPDHVAHTLRTLPGQYPDRHSHYSSTTTTTTLAPRPKSSGILSHSPAHTATSWASFHSRYASQPTTLTTTETTDFDPLETPRLRRHGNLQNNTSIPPLPPPLNSAALQQSPTSVIDRPFPHDSDSADSVTAASTVWDELDDLKSRIRKLETGRLPLTSNAAIAAGRPRTATTAPTALSSSPKNVMKSPLDTNQPQNVHPTLQSALTRARTTLQPHIYRPLEATVMDALGLATMSGSQPSPTAITTSISTVNGSALSDRHLRRKADSLCRNLADLCIAVCDTRKEDVPLSSSPTHSQIAKPISPGYYSPQYAESRQGTASVVGERQSRRGSLGGARLDNFRAARGLSINGDEPLSPSITARDYASKYASIQDQRGRQRFSAEPETNIARPPSRAMTDLDGVTGRTSKLDHLRAAPSAQRSPSLRETLEARRRSANFRFDDDTQSAVGISSSQTPAARRFLDRVRGPASEVGSTTPSLTRFRETYLTTPRLTTPATRATSLGQGRFGPTS